MRYRKLGNTGMTVSEIGFGTWGLGGDSYGPVDDAVAQQALRLALGLGITFYDTSDLYGSGRSEEILGKTFRDCRDKVILATKVGMLPHTGFNMPQDFSAAHITRSIEASLRRLQSEYTDLYQLHSPPGDLPNWAEILATLEGLKRAGKIRAFGISARSPADAKTAIEQFGFEAVQVNFNMIDHRAIDSKLFELCRLNRVGVIARTPLCFGYLSGKLNGNEEFQGPDHRANWPREQLRRWGDASKLFLPLNEGKLRTLVQLALQFCLSDECVSTVVPGMMTPDEVRENAVAADGAPLSESELETIRCIYLGNTFYDPSVKQRERR